MPGSERRSCSAAEAHAAARDPMDRRHSTSSESSLPEAPHFRQSSQENIEYIPTRTSKVTASKPAANPLQFVKVGPCDLYRSAQEQIRKVEEVKKIKQEKRDEAEDWQSNLDNWKSSRRKRQEHIIERVVEVKKFELEEYDRNRRRSKTFNEMMEERNSRGRKVSLVMFKNDDMNDLSDLGIAPTSAKSSICGDNDHINELNLTNKEEADCRQFDNHNFESNSNGMIDIHDNNFHSEAEEYTYERAIQSYVNFAETRVKSKSPGANSYNEQNENLSRLKENLEAENGNIPNGHERKKLKIPPPLPAKPKKGFEIRRQSSGDLNSFPDNNRKLPLPKVDVLKKREIFERAAEASNLQPKIPSEFSNSKSIKNRILNIENKNEVNNQSAEYVATVHERIASIKNQNSFDNVNEKGNKTRLRLSDNDKTSLNSVKDGISRVNDDLSNGSDKESWKDINSNLKVACEMPGNDVMRDSVQNQKAHYVSPNNGVEELEHNYVHPVKCFTSTKSKVVSLDEDLLQSKPKFHRSLDSLDMEGSSGCGNETFERVQSLEDLECCSHTMNYPPSSSSTEMFALSCLSGDTDREDSGIHTADVSCSVSQADEPVEDGEIVTMISSVIPHLVLDKNGKKDYHLEVQLVQHKQAEDSTVKSECSPSFLSENSLITGLAMVNLSDKIISDSSTSHNSVAVSVPLDQEVVVPEYTKTLVSSEISNISNVTDSSECSAQCHYAVEQSINGAGKNTNSEDHACRSLIVSQSETSSELDIIGGSVSRILNSEGGVDNSTHLSSPVIEPFYNLHDHSIDNTNKSEINIIDPLITTDNDVYIEETQESKVTEPVQTSTETIFNNLTTIEGVPSIQDNSIMVHVHDNPITSLEKRRTVVEVFEELTLDLDNGDKRILPTHFFNVPMCGVETETITQDEVIIEGEHDASGASQMRIDKVPINLIEEMPNSLKKDNLEISYYGNKDKEEESIIPAFTNQIPPLSLSGDIEIVDGLPFPLGTLTSAEPPKEKPPPPPEYLSDEDAILKESTLRRLDSTKRIKKEIRRKRSDFLGIEGKSDDSYLEPELQVAPPPDMTSFLMEEQRLEKELYRQSICSESDSNHGETTESRDSGVELEKGISDDTWPTKQLLTPDVLSAGHSRQNSEIFGNASMTSEEDEITKKEREIIEILEKEEQWRYGTQQNHIGEKLAEKLRLLEEEKMRLEWERAEEANRRESEELARMDEELRLKTKEAELRQQETTLIDNCDKIDVKEGDNDGAALQSERTRLQKQQEELVRQQESLLHAQCWGTNVHSSLQDVSCKQPTVNSHPPVVYSYRYSLPDLQQEPEQHVAVQQLPVQPLPRTSTSRYAPPPIPPAKPVRNNQEQREREHSIRNSRMPSADCIPKQLENSNASLSQATGQQMSKQTRQALSAAPRPRFISTDNWIQAKKKPEVKRNSLNNHHWLIQEAEHRRITEQQHRNAMSPRKVPPPHPEVPQLWPQKQQQPVLRQEKPLPDSIIQTLTQRVQNRVEAKKPVIRPRVEESPSRDTLNQIPIPNTGNNTASSDSQEKILSVSGKKKCSHCGDELGRGAAMIIESLRLFYHIDCFKCCVCHVQLGDGLMGTDVRVRNNKLHCHNCYSSDDGVKFSCV